MNNEEKILAMLEQLTADMTDVKSEQTEMKEDIGFVRGAVVRMEQEHGKKLDALFDGYRQLHEKTTAIEEHVTAQDEVILRRVFPKIAD